VKSHRTAGWQSKRWLEVLQQAGFRQTTDDPIAPGNYAAFLSRKDDTCDTPRDPTGRADGGAAKLKTLSIPYPEME